MDAVDRARQEWQRAVPGLNVAPADVLARIERLGHLIEAAQNDRLRRRSGRRIANRGDYDVLRTLRRMGEPYSLAPNEINSATLVSAAGLSGRLKRLEAEGWITREPSQTDGRSLLVMLTEQGRAELDEGLAPHFAFEETLLDPLSDEERASLTATLRKLLLHLENGDQQST